MVEALCGAASRVIANVLASCSQREENVTAPNSWHGKNVGILSRDQYGLSGFSPSSSVAREDRCEL